MSRPEEILIGVDSGGTKTIASALTIDGQMIGMGFGGATNINFVGENDAIYAMRSAVAMALGMEQSEPTPLPQARAVYLSAPGFSDYAAERALRDICPEAEIKVEGDARAAFRAAIPSGDGIVVLSGTGSFASGLWRGKWLTNGGWGPLLGDEGSGYWIGLAALRAVALAADHRGPKTSLQDVFRRVLHYSFDIELRTFAYKSNLDRQKIAALTILVTQAAKEGDQVALSILEQAGKELAKLAANLAQRLGTSGSTVPVSLVGGVARKDSPVVEAFQRAAMELIPGAEYVVPRFEPWVGAVLLAFELANVRVTPRVIKRMEEIVTAKVKT